MSAIINPSLFVFRAILLVLSWMFMLFNSAFAQQSISGQINNYAAVTEPNACPNKVTVSTTNGFAVNGKVLIIQMQGAMIDESNSANFGNISLNQAGQYEKATIAAIDGDELTFTHDLINIYDESGSVQVVTIPQYTDVTVTGTLRAAPWNGITGGILAFEASGTVTLNADIVVDGAGFRGGAITNDPNNDNDCNFTDSRNAYFYEASSLYAAFKGEGIAKGIAGKELGRGPQANGGGAGNDHNSGGGGGGNWGQGGTGGQNDEPGFFRCKGYFPGLGGNSITSTDRIFLGGGGGGGHTNNNLGTAGGDGGGIIYISANQLNGNGRRISANGINALMSTGDGAGGGGGGGTVLLRVTTAVIGDLRVEARGGNGGEADNENGNRCFGPGGGGAGGVIASNAQGFPNDIEQVISGGQAGITINSSNSGCNNETNGASDGGAGTLLTNVTIPESTLSPSQTCSPLPVDFVSFSADIQSGKVHLKWITASETNNAYFSVERSSDAVQFSEISRVKGKGTVTAFSQYQYTDLNPFTGISYYRLRQVDTDGKFAYSKTVVVEHNPAELAVALYPNPVAENQIVFLQIAAPALETVQVQVMTLLGESVSSTTHQLNSGTHLIEMNTGGFSAGIYLIHVRSGNTVKTLKLQVL